MAMKENNSIDKHTSLLRYVISITIRNLNVLSKTLINVTTNYMDTEENSNINTHTCLLYSGIYVTIRNLNVLAT